MTKNKRVMSSPGTLSLFTGVPGSGKTTSALKYAEIILKKEPDIKVITNINMHHNRKAYLEAMAVRKGGYLSKYEKKEYVQKWGEWIEIKDRFLIIHSMMEFLEILPDHDRILLVLDEAGIFASSGYSSKGKDIGEWEQFLKLSRKFGVSIFWIDQRGAGSIPPTMRELATYHIHKPDTFLMETWGGIKDGEGSKRISNRKLTEKDDTGVPFDTLSSASFRMNLPVINDEQLTMRHLFDHIADVNYSLLRPTIKEWVADVKRNLALARVEQERENNSSGEDERPPLTLKEIVFWILDDREKKKQDPPGPSDIGKFLDRKPQSISRIIKEWKDLQKAES